MRSLTIVKFLAKIGLAVLFAAGLTGCLVSDIAVLDENTGRARVLRDGLHLACSIEDDADEDDCETFVVTRVNGGYTFDKDGEEPVELRFKRVGRKGWAVQSAEDDGYMYYYGAGDAKRLRLTMMQCADLPEDLRAKLISRGDLEAQDEKFTTCKVNTVAGLVAAAKAYHRGDVIDEETLVMEIAPAPDLAPEVSSDDTSQE